MSRGRRVDANHGQIRDSLRMIPGCEVADLSQAGGGVPDLLVAFRGRLYLMEVKDGAKPPSRRHLTDDEIAFRRRFGEHYFVVTSLDDALAVLGLRKVAA